MKVFFLVLVPWKYYDNYNIPQLQYHELIYKNGVYNEI